MRRRPNIFPKISAIAANCPVRRTLVQIALLIALAALSFGCRLHGGHANRERNVLLNGDLTSGSGNSPDHWNSAAWQPATAVFRWNHGAGAPGELQVSSAQPNDAHWSQTVHLAPGWYHFSASMRAEGVPHGGGGAILYDFVNGAGSEALYGTTGWQTVGFYLKAGRSGADVKLACRLGGFASLNTGKAFCRNLSAIEIDKPPPGATGIFDLALMRSSGASPQAPANEAAITPQSDASLGHAAPAASLGDTLFEYSLDIVDWVMAVLVLLAGALMIALSTAGTPASERSQPGGLWQEDQAIAIGWPRWLRKREANAQAAMRTARRGTTAGSLSGVTSGFFVMTLVLACVRIAPIAWFKSGPNRLVLFAAAIAMAGLAVRLINQEDTSSRFRVNALSPEGWSALAVFTAFLAFYAVTGFAETGYNEQVRQAVAFLHGHTYIDAPQNSYIEYYQDGPYKYALHPALSAILLIPLVSIWGSATPQTAFSVLVGALDVVLVWRLLGRLLLNVNARIWLTVFFGCGTVFWFETIQGTSWSLPMVIAVCFVLAALIEVFGRARPVWLGSFVALASLARYDLVLCAPVFAGLIYLRGRRIKEILWMAPGFVVVGAVFVALNEARFHSFFDMGVILNRNGPKGQPIFSLKYLPGNLYTIFFMAPSNDSSFPYIHPTFMGQAIPLTSPAFVLALRASLRRVESLMLWLAAFLGSLPSLLCWMNGYAQFGTRHYIPVFPFLLVLMAFGIHRRADQLTKILIGVSIGLVAFGIWHIHMWGFG